ncbi:hypothetical protein TCAL_09067 [Tigriopus californicus]|uniref:DUF5641 domain-containing protein n=1 Tax=Tigriopus californicus TaxID=6832 RepID=A0A553NNM6_TIGCA|nr:hypothetical protein TCAL_09067 [Tigriopus californicus]|eukprot:TCALIF_09067-PA protein Name:"Protein of unknown function" AED:0.30 eAED:0.30 QI:0/-1/0/1/-1/1/1/0/133
MWQSEYLLTLLARSKWRSQERNLCVGDVVLVVDNNLPRGKWRWGYISEVYPGMDGLVRKAKVSTPKGEFLRPVVKLVLLERAKEPIDGGDPPVASAPGGGDVPVKCECRWLPEKKETEGKEKVNRIDQVLVVT